MTLSHNILVKFLSLLSFLSEHIETKWNLTFSVLSRSEKLKFIFPRVSNSLDEVCYFEGTYVFFNRVSAKFSGKNIKNFFPNPSTFGECGECKVVGVDLPETWNQTKNDSMIYFVTQRWTSFWQIFTHHETFSTGFCPFQTILQLPTIFCIVGSFVVSIVCEARPFSFQGLCFEFCLKKINFHKILWESVIS